MFFTQMIHLQLTLFLYIVLGIILHKLTIITVPGQKCLSSLTINLILPCNIIASFLGDHIVSQTFLKNCVITILISSAIQLCSIFCAKYFFPGFPEQRKNILIYGLIVSNSSFIGIPVISALYGNTGVLYTSLFQLPARVGMWSHGLALFTDTDRQTSYKKLLLHPCIIAILIGLFVSVIPFSLPSLILDPIHSISQCTIPISMLAIGSMLSGARIKQLLDPAILYYCFLRLLLYPLLVFGVLTLFHTDPLVLRVSVLLSAMPMAGTTAILADQYDSDPAFASRTIFASTLLSIVTLPLLSLLL